MPYDSSLRCPNHRSENAGKIATKIASKSDQPTILFGIITFLIRKPFNHVTVIAKAS